MKNLKNESQSKRIDKKTANIKWNSRLFFQIGVITSLLLVFFVMQTDFETKVAEYKPTNSYTIEEPPIIEYRIDIDEPKPVEPVKKVIKKREPIQKVVKSNTFEVKPNTSTDVETPVLSNSELAEITPEPKKMLPVETGPKKPSSITNVEFVPVYPGCESLGSNSEKVACMSSKINSFINKNFRNELLENLTKNETYRIYVNFKIDSNGFVTDVVANSHNSNLKREAQRVINNLPTMKPGKQGNLNVDVMYTIPIVFKIQ